MHVRETAVAGMFYPKQKIELEKQLQNFFSKANVEIEKVKDKTIKIKDAKSEFSKTSAVISPHAGYIYSGQTAAIAISQLKQAKTYVIFCPNHTGMGSEISISDSDCWETPMGRIPVDLELGKKISEKTSAEFDELAHVGEHAVEVQIPFLQYLFGIGFKILPITIATSDFEKLEELGRAIFEIEQKEKLDLAIIASSDFTHYESEKIATEKDSNAIKKIKELDAKGFHKMVLEQNLSICGFAGITATMQYCLEKGMKKGILLKYDTSATAFGDKSRVVGYAAIEFE